jgi:hypothetical protein
VRHTSALLLLVALATPARAQVSGSPAPVEIDLRTFVDTMDRIGSDLEEADPRRLNGVLVGIPSRLRVKAGDEHFDVPLEPVAQLITAAKRDPSKWPEERQTIRRQLLAMKNEALTLLEHSMPPSRADPHAALASILARKEFARAAPADWTARLRALITDWLLGLWDRVGGNRFDMRRAAMTLVWLSTLAAIAGLIFWFNRNARRRIARDRDAVSASPVVTTARGWALRALAAIRDGRATEAVRFTYSAGVTRLAELGIWRVDEARTAREYVTLLPSVEARDRAFRDIAGQFERVVYANRPATADDLGRLVAHLETLGCLRPHERAI